MTAPTPDHASSGTPTANEASASLDEVWDSAQARLAAVDQKLIDQQQRSRRLGIPNTLDDPDDPFTAEFHQSVRAALALRDTVDRASEYDVHRYARAIDHVETTFLVASANAAAANGPEPEPLADLGRRWHDMSQAARAADVAQDHRAAPEDRDAAAAEILEYALRRANDGQN
ncbi:hypothetical protein [Gordonia sihwensis]|uniref:hypothetical protein n=1 Tax=Gordonia sihwensis TaxID=173559 RepID=UPI003D9690AB